MRVLAVEDNLEVSRLIQEFLSSHGFVVDCAATGGQAMRMAESGYEAVILDVDLPDTDGFEVLKHLRATSKVPVILLTHRSEEDDRIAGLDLGADDYLPKPFSPRELLARLRAVLRRAPQSPTHPSGAVSANGVTLNPAARDVACDGEVVAITSVEFTVLEILMRAAGRPVSRDELMMSLYGRKATPYDRSIDMHISHLRKKLTQKRELIKTVRGAGYQFCVKG